MADKGGEQFSLIFSMGGRCVHGHVKRKNRKKDGKRRTEGDNDNEKEK